MEMQNILNLIKKSDIFEHLFMYVDDATNENINIFIDYNEENIIKYKEKIDWLYLSNFTYGYMVGVNNKGKVITLTNELDEIEYCDSIYEIPFCFWYEEYSLNNEDYSTVGKEIKLKNIETYNLLVEYRNFLNKNNIKINQKYFNLIGND